MQEILPGVFHRITFHEGIQEDGHSYYAAATDLAIVIDQVVPVRLRAVVTVWCNA